MSDLVLSEESVVSKVSELMETLDQLKRYNVLARSLKKFALIVIGSIAVFLVVAGLFTILRFEYSLTRPVSFVYGFIVLLIPLIGVGVGVNYVKKQVNQTKTGAWKTKLSEGFPAALEVILELDWEKTLDEIYAGRLSHMLYVLLKTGAYWIVTAFGLKLVANIATLYFFYTIIPISSLVTGLSALIIVLLVVGKDILRRCKEINSLDMLLLELRWFSLELRRAEFQT
jgi:hypothetical protein